MEQSVQTINIVFLTIGVVLSSTMLVSFFVSPNIMLIAMAIYFIVYSTFILSYHHRHRDKLGQSGMQGNIVMYATIYNIMISFLIVLLVIFLAKKPSNSASTPLPANVFKRPVFYV